MTTNTNNKLTDETLSAWKTEAKISLGETARDSVDYSHHEAILALVTEIQEHRKAAAEPVLYVMGMGCAFDAETASTCKGAVDSWVGEWNQERLPGQEEYKTVPLYTTPQSAPERDQIRREHAAWSQATFGDVGPVGSLKHLSKEALEAAAEPGDLSEWADMQFLLWDAQRRAGISDEQITLAMKEKLAVNKKREWPEPKDGEPRLHIKEQPVPVVPEEITADGIIGMHECGFVEGWNACRTAMLNGDIFRENSISSTNNFREIAETSTNSPVIPDGYALVPVEPTDEMIAAAMECDDVVFDSKDPTAFCVQFREIYCAIVDTAPKQENI